MRELGALGLPFGPLDPEAYLLERCVHAPGLHRGAGGLRTGLRWLKQFVPSPLTQLLLSCDSLVGTRLVP